jgi:dihydroorotate dehydrogenase
MIGPTIQKQGPKELISIPDWSYRTLFRPALFRLQAETARDFTLKSMGLLCKLPGGRLVIRTLGHMELSPILDISRLGLRWKYPVGLGGGLDIHGDGQDALAQIGFGFIEIGPITSEEIVRTEPVRLDINQETIIYPDRLANDGLEKTRERLRSARNKSSLPLLLRLSPMPGASAEEQIEQILSMTHALKPYASAFCVDILTDHAEQVQEEELSLASCLQAVRAEAPGKPAFLRIPLSFPIPRLEKLVHDNAQSINSWDGFIIGDGVFTELGYEIGKHALQPALAITRELADRISTDQVITTSGGIHEPAHAIQAIQAGADFVQLHSGLVYSGPGLPKRINEAMIYDRIRHSEPMPIPSFWKHWGWMCLLGLGMILGGALACLIAATWVLLPYDIAYLGMDHSQIHALNDRLLPFMAHDRLTLAGTMISIGIIYYQLGRHGLRRELHWAKTAAITSGIVGFSSFLLYLGYGYFDPIHALAAALLLPMFILAMRGGGNRPSDKPPNLLNDRSWLLAQWGQLCFVLLGSALAVGGLTIAWVGMNGVFVHTDLEYLRTTASALADANPRLIPVIAHDRAGFGGALFSDSVALLAIALWGIQQGERWVWWTLLLGGPPGFISVLLVHYSIGYTSFVHLLPVYIAIALYIAGLALLYPYLINKKSLA